MPGRTAGGSVGAPSGTSFNGGPGNCPAERRFGEFIGYAVELLLQWRAGQLPGRTRQRLWSSTSMGSRLQWRAGQLPGRTRPRRSRPAAPSCRFNGGPGNCPAERLGRGPRCRRARSFNGGPGNCPAEPDDPALHIHNVILLQWRAGQLPGRTPHATTLATTPRIRASMEGRAIARPNLSGGCACSYVDGPLQWRAGQLPGRTGGCAEHVVAAGVASMEGRAIARPNKLERAPATSRLR